MPREVEIAGRYTYIDYDDGANVNLGAADAKKQCMGYNTRN